MRTVVDVTEVAPTLTPAFKATARSIARENASALTARGTRRTRRFHFRNGPDGGGLPVLLIPGFLTGDWSMANMAKVLKSWNFAPLAAAGNGVTASIPQAR